MSEAVTQKDSASAVLVNRVQALRLEGSEVRPLKRPRREGDRN